jgi:polygalacturonase
MKSPAAKILILFLPLCLAITCNNMTSTYSILDYGARGDGKTLNTKAINKAIEKCNAKGGGTVLIPPGIFVTGTIKILSNVNLHLAGESDFRSKNTRQGEEFMKESTIDDGPVTYPFKPGLLISLEQCENIHLADIILKDSPEWTIKISDCDNVEVHSISILNNKLIPNNDGIHVTPSRNVRI